MEFIVPPDLEVIKKSIADDPILVGKEQKIGDPLIDAGMILEKEETLSSELHDLNSLKAISNLVLEFKTNLDLLELENCYYSLQNIRKKIHDNNHILVKQSFHFQRSLSVYVDSLHVQLIEKIYEIVSQGFWDIQSDSYKFQSKVEWGQDKVEFNYTEFMEFVKVQYFPSDSLDPQSWFIENMEFGDSKDKVRTLLSTLLKEYIHMTRLINQLKETIFTEGSHFKYDSTDKSIKIITIKLKDQEQVIKYSLESFKSLNMFLKDGINSADLAIILNHLGHILSTELSKFIKKYASLILGKRDSSLKNDVSQIYEQLNSLSQTVGHSWRFNGSEIEDLLNDNQLYINLLVDEAFSHQTIACRSVFKNDWKKKKTVELPIPRLQPPIAQTPKKSTTGTKSDVEYKPIRAASFSGKNNPSPKKAESEFADEGDWGWDPELDIEDEQVENSEQNSNVVINDEMDEDVNDAWDEEFNVELDDSKPNTPKKQNKVLPQHIMDEDEDGGWNNEWDIGEEGVTIKKTENLAPTETIVKTIQITSVPEQYQHILKEFKEACDRIGEDKLDLQYYTYKFNLLQTSLFALSISHYQVEWYQFYIDMRYLCANDVELSRMKELTDRYLENFILLKEKKIHNLIETQLKDLHDHENRASLMITIETLIPFFKTTIVPPLLQIGGSESENSLLRILDFIYNQCIINSVLRWSIISEQNSIQLGELISLVFNNTEIPSLQHIARYREYREKFALIGRFLPLHLKEIMEMFYNGDFYLFNTQELVKFITLLFADTPLRKDAISDIYEIREVSLDDQ